MSFEEKSTWIHGILSVVVSGVYFSRVLGQARHTAVTEIAYEWPMIAAMGIAVVLSIVAHIVIAIASPKEANKSDERDTDINRYGEYIGSYVLATAAFGALIMAMAEFEHFWIANTIYLAFVLTALTVSAVKIVAYRRAF